MRFMQKSKDGGPESPVDGFFIIEIKGLFSVVLLKFNQGCREAFHTHAFNALTWFLKGSMVEEDVEGPRLQYRRSLLPKLTRRDKMHRVIAHKDSWAISFRGPWRTFWQEYDPKTDVTTVFNSGRVVVAEY